MIGSNKSAKLGIIFDRDGTLIHFVNYLSDYKKVKIYNDAFRKSIFLLISVSFNSFKYIFKFKYVFSSNFLDSNGEKCLNDRVIIPEFCSTEEEKYPLKFL